MKLVNVLMIIVFSSSVFAGELVFREFPVPDNNPQTMVWARKTEGIYAVVEAALRAEGFGELAIDSAEWREGIPSERRKTPYRVVQHKELPAESVGGHLNIYEFTVDSVRTPVFRFAVNGIQKDPYRFRDLDEGWVLEVKNFRHPDSSGWSAEVDYAVIANGRELNRERKLDACWGYRHIGDLPFYFFQRDGEVGWFYDDEETIMDYDIVEHDRCCKDVLMNPHFFYNALTFFAQRDDQWYQVVGMLKPDHNRPR